MAVTFESANNKVTVDIDGSGGIFDSSSIVQYSNTENLIILRSHLTFDVNDSLKFDVTEIVGRPSDNPQEVAEYLRNNYFNG